MGQSESDPLPRQHGQPMRLRRWEYGIATIEPTVGRPGPVHPADDEATARAEVADRYPWAVLYRRPQPKPWRLVPTTGR